MNLFLTEILMEIRMTEESFRTTMFMQNTPHSLPPPPDLVAPIYSFTRGSSTRIGGGGGMAANPPTNFFLF